MLDNKILIFLFSNINFVTLSSDLSLSPLNYLLFGDYVYLNYFVKFCFVWGIGIHF